jgi:AcrR family transcriptional regulator
VGAKVATVFHFEQFKQMTPLTADNIWGYIFERNAERIGVRRLEPALKNLAAIFQATFRLANNVGFRAMSLRDLCRESGLSMGGLYGYIDSKTQLAEMIEDVVRHATEQLAQMFNDVAAPLDQLEALLRAVVYLSEILQPWFYFVYMDSRELAVEQRSMAKASELHIQNRIAAIIVQCALRPDDNADLLASHFLALSQDWYIKRWKYRAAGVGVDHFADSLVRTMRACLR